MTPVLHFAVLRWAGLDCISLCRAVLCCAALGWAGLCCALLCWAGLGCAVLCCAVLCCAVMSKASCGAGGRPLVIAEPWGQVAQQFMTLGAAVVQEIAKLKLKPRNSVRSDSSGTCCTATTCIAYVKQLLVCNFTY